MFVVFFFFQAEDGIRDIGVTGVQTCALPIYQQLGRATVFVAIAANVFGCTQTIAILMTGQLMQPHYQRYYQLQIGRASCRERV